MKISKKQKAIKILPLILDAHGDTEEEAWKNFKTELNNVMSLIKGCVYWRVTPTLKKESYIDFEKTGYLVVGRIIVIDKKIPGNFNKILGISEIPQQESEYDVGLKG